MWECGFVSVGTSHHHTTPTTKNNACIVTISVWKSVRVEPMRLTTDSNPIAWQQPSLLVVCVHTLCGKQHVFCGRLFSRGVPRVASVCLGAIPSLLIMISAEKGRRGHTLALGYSSPPQKGAKRVGTFQSATRPKAVDKTTTQQGQKHGLRI